MPELPEVESVRRGLEEHISGLRFVDVEVLHPRANRGQDEPLSALLQGRSVVSLGRRGKFMWMEIDGQDLADPHRDVVHVHLGMSGQMRVGDVNSRHVRIRARLESGNAQATQLSFIDQRTFGYWLCAPWSKISHIGLDPLEAGFDVEKAARALRAKRSPIKVALLDQCIISGIGNIYADEALWKARVNPQRAGVDLGLADAVRVVDCARDVMVQALAVGGTSFDSLYVNVNGESGYFDRSLEAYGRTEQPCSRCGTSIRRIVLGGRGTHFCPVCQT